MVIAFCIALVTLGRRQTNDVTSAKQLSPKSRPTRHFVGLNDEDIVTVSRYSNKQSPYPTFVYRYSFRGDLAQTLAAFQKRLTDKDGWTTEILENGEVVLDHLWKTGPVSHTALLFHQAKLIPDAHGGHVSKTAADKDWIWVSYNEQIRRKN